MYEWQLKICQTLTLCSSYMTYPLFTLTPSNVTYSYMYVRMESGVQIKV